MFIVTCQKNQAKVTQTEPITSGSQNVYVVQFRLSEEWDSLVATAVFMAGNRTIVNVLLDEDRECMIPWEVMQTAGEQVMVGVFGTMNGNVVLPTIWANMGNLQQGVTTGVYPSEPTPDIYQQILGEIRRIKDQMEDGIPYAIDGIVNHTVTNLSDLSHLNLPANVILLNSGFAPIENEETSLYYQNEIVYLEIVDSSTIRLTDYEGNVYDFLTDEEGNITEKIFVRDGTIKTPYQLALENGFVGTEKEWLNSLKGPLPVYYKGGSLTVDASFDNVMTKDHVISKDDVSRYPSIGECLIIPVNGKNNEAYLITYRVDGYDEAENLVCKPASILNVSGKIGPVGPTGPMHLWVDGSSTVETIKSGDSINVLNTSFNREPIQGENANGTIISEGVKPPYLYFVSGTIDSVYDSFSTIKVRIASNLHVTIDAFVPEFITSEDVDSIRSGVEIGDKENGVVGVEALGKIMGIFSEISNKNILNNWYFADPVNTNGKNEYTPDPSRTITTIDNWKIYGGTNNDTKVLLKNGYIQILRDIGPYQTVMLQILDDIPFRGKTLTASILTKDQILAVTSLEVPDDDISNIHSFQGSTNYINDTCKIDIHRNVEGGTTSLEVRIIGTSSTVHIDVSIVAVKLELGTEQTLAHKEGDIWVLNDPPPNKDLELIKCNLSAFYSKLVEASPNPLAINKGGTGETDLTEMLYKAIDQVGTLSVYDPSKCYVVFGHQNDTTANISKMRFSHILQWATGSTGQINTAKTDYTTYRTRPTALLTTAPTTTPNNGYIYGIYE